LKGGEEMKKITLALFFVAFVSSLCFAQQASAPVSQAVQTPAVAHTFTSTGKVDSTIIGDTTKGIRSELAIIDANGKTVSFVVKSSVSITDKDAKVITLNDIKKDSKVTVEYTISNKGINRAQSIKLVE